MIPKTISLILDETGNDSTVKRTAIIETLLTAFKPEKISTTERLIGSYTATFEDKTVIYGHSKSDFNTSEAFLKLRAETMMRSHAVDILTVTVSTILPAVKEDIDVLAQEHNGTIIVPLLGAGYFWNWVPEWSKNHQDRPVFSYLVRQLSDLSGESSLSPSIIEDFALLEEGKIEFISYDTRNTRYVFCSSILEESLTNSVFAEDLDLYLFRTKGSSLFGNSHIILSGCSVDTKEYKYLFGCADIAPIKIAPNSTVVIDRKNGTHQVKFINTQAIVKGVN